MQVDETDRTGSSSESALLASRQAMVTRSSSLQRLDKAKPLSTRWEEVLDELTSLVDGYEAMSLQIPSAALFALNKLAQRASQLNGDTSSVDFLITSSQPVFPLLDLPDHVVAHALSFLSSRQLVKTASVSKQWTGLLTQAAALRVLRMRMTLPTPMEGESILRLLNFVEQVAQRRPMTIAAGSAHTLCITEAGTLLSCGGDSVGDRRFLGHLGHGVLHGDFVPVPKQVVGVDAEEIKEVAARGYGCMILSEEGDVWNWGWNEDGRLGHPGEHRHLPSPRRLVALERELVVQVACGERHGLALTSAGEVWSWGRASHGQLGHGVRGADGAHLPARIEALSGTRVVEVSAGGLHSLAVSDAGELFSWGAGRDGKLGHGDIELQPTPKRVEALRGVVIKRASAGDGHSLVICSLGRLYSFGLGECGRLGHGDEENKLVPRPVVTSTPISQCAAGFYHSVALARNGLVYTFGDGAYGKLGHGDTLDRLTPTIVVHGTRFQEVAAGYQHTVLRDQHGVVHTAGIGWKGQLGQGELEEPVDFFHSRQFRRIAESE